MYFSILVGENITIVSKFYKNKPIRVPNDRRYGIVQYRGYNYITAGSNYTYAEEIIVIM